MRMFGRKKFSTQVLCSIQILWLSPLALVLLAVFSGELYGAHCPPDSIEDCRAAVEQGATNPLVPLAGAVAGALAPLVLGRRPKTIPKGGTSVSPTWDPWVYMGGPGDNPYTSFDGGRGPGRCSRFGLPNYWVNTATLGLVVQDTVFVCQGLGPAIKLQLSYNSGLGKTGMFGANWTFAYESIIRQSGDTIYLWKGSGQRLHYRLNASTSASQSGTAQEATAQNSNTGRLFDHGQYWLFLEKHTHLTYRYEKSAEVGVSRLTSITDPNGNSVRISYNDNGAMSAITDATGRSILFSYDNQKRCTSCAVPTGRTAKFSYDGQGNLIQAVDLQGVITEYQYDAEHSLTRMIVGGSRKTTTFIYQDGVSAQEKRIVDVTDAGGNTTLYEMIAVDPRQVQVIDPEGRLTVYDSTPEGFTKKITDPLGNAVEFGYANGLRVSMRNKNGQSARMEYDTKGNLTRVTDPLGNMSSLAYDANDNLISSTTPLGETTRYTYDDRSQLTRVTSPLGNALSFHYDAKGQVDVVTDANGQKSHFGYDLFGNLTAITNPVGDTIRIAYDATGLTMTSMTDARGNTAQYTFDDNARLTQVTHSDGATRTQVYDCCAGIATIDENGNKTEFVRGHLLQVEQLLDPMGKRAGYNYDRSGRLIEMWDALDRRWLLTYDDAGRVIQVTDPLQQMLKMDYDPEGNLLTLEDERAKQTHCTFDTRNLPTQLIDPLGQANRISWDALKRVQTLVNARGGKISFAYDSDGRLTAKSYEGVEVAAFQYDANGRLTSMRDSTGETAYIHDAAGRVTSVRYPDGWELSLSYDAAGNISTITYPNGLVVTYSYDTRNRIARATWGKHAITFRYDVVSNLLSESRSNGTESTYRYNANRQVTEITHRSGTDRFASMMYRRDVVGNIIEESAVLPIVPELSDIAVTSTYNDANQIVTRGSDAYTYDADGNLTSISGGKWHAVYDADNRPVEIRRNAQATRYTYDGLGQRRKVTSGVSVRNSYYDSLGRLLFETDASGRITVCYVYCGATLVARANPNQESHFYHFDKTGSTVALTGTNGQVSTAYAYSPFGAVVKTSGPADDNPFTYGGQYGVMDEGQGLFFMQNRYYDAHTGRFLQKDPIGFAGDINLYAYVGNNPVNYLDPSGLFGWGYVYQALRRFSGQTKEMAELAGKMLDTLTGAGLTMAGAELIPAPIMNSKVGYALDYLQLSGGRAAVYLSKHLVEVAVTTGTNVAAVTVLGGLLAAAGGIEIGHALHSTYARARGRALGADIADLGWDFYEYMFTGPGRSRRLFPPLSPESSEQPVAVDCAGPYLGYQ